MYLEKLMSDVLQITPQTYFDSIEHHFSLSWVMTATVVMIDVDDGQESGTSFVKLALDMYMAWDIVVGVRQRLIINIWRFLEEILEASDHCPAIKHVMMCHALPRVQVTIFQFSWDRWAVHHATKF